MAVYVNDLAMDAALDYIATGTTLVLCSAQPTTYAEANSTYKLAGATLTPGDASGDWTIAAGDTSGRKLTLGAQTTVGTANGTATHYAIITGSVLLLANTMTNVAISNGINQDVNAVDVWEIRDPA